MQKLFLHKLKLDYMQINHFIFSAQDEKSQETTQDAKETSLKSEEGTNELPIKLIIEIMPRISSRTKKSKSRD
jgi:hypothetical protein